MFLTNKLLLTSFLMFQICLSCENNNQDQTRKYTREQLLALRNHLQEDPEYQKKINEIKEQLLSVLGNQIRMSLNSPAEDQNDNLEN